MEKLLSDGFTVVPEFVTGLSGGVKKLGKFLEQFGQ
jgi:hypothetical protein